MTVCTGVGKDQAIQDPSMEERKTHEAPPLVEELLENDDCRQSESFVRDVMN